jgi:predicted tellurium resistance membrane protein TerC
MDLLQTWLLDPHAWLALLTLTALEIVLGIDNIIFLTILVGRLPKKEQPLARVFGLSFAMATRIALLFSLVWVMRLTTPLFTLFDYSFSGRDLILFFGGLFLMAKSIHEIHKSMEEHETPEQQLHVSKRMGFISVVLQIGIIDIIFSLDSVITAVGLVDQVSIMVIAIVIAIVVMMLAAKTIGEIVEKHPTIKMLALSFLILVGFALISEGLGLHIPKGYLYFAMAYSVLVEMLNLKIRSKKT